MCKFFLTEFLVERHLYSHFRVEKSESLEGYIAHPRSCVKQEM